MQMRIGTGRTLMLLCLLTAGIFAASWERIADMPKPMQELPSIHMNGKVYVAGGMDANSCCNATNYFAEYDIASNKWTIKANLKIAVNHPGIAALDGKIYVLSGYTGGSFSGQGVTNKCFRWTPSSNSWQEIASLPEPAAAPGVVTWKGKIYLFGGDYNKQFDNAAHKKVFEYDPGADKWTVINSSWPEGKMHIGAGIVGGKVYISPGRPSRINKTCWEFDFAKAGKGAEAWKKMPDEPGSGVTGYIANWPVVNGKLYYIGGETQSGVKAESWTFTPNSGGGGGKWEKFTDYVYGIHGIGPCTDGGTIWVCGGGTSANVGGRTNKCYKIKLGDAVASNTYRASAKQQLQILRTGDTYSVALPDYGAYSIDMFNASGKVIASYAGYATDADDISLRPVSGTHILRVQAEGKTVIERIINSK